MIVKVSMQTSSTVVHRYQMSESTIILVERDYCMVPLPWKLKRDPRIFPFSVSENFQSTFLEC